MRTQHASVLSVGLTAKFIVRAQLSSDAAVIVTAKFIVKAQQLQI